MPLAAWGYGRKDWCGLLPPRRKPKQQKEAVVVARPVAGSQQPLKRNQTHRERERERERCDEGLHVKHDCLGHGT